MLIAHTHFLVVFSLEDDCLTISHTPLDPELQLVLVLDRLRTLTPLAAVLVPHLFSLSLTIVTSSIALCDHAVAHTPHLQTSTLALTLDTLLCLRTRLCARSSTGGAEDLLREVEVGCTT
jgi:hypothetical protein